MHVQLSHGSSRPALPEGGFAQPLFYNQHFAVVLSQVAGTFNSHFSSSITVTLGNDESIFRGHEYLDSVAHSHMILSEPSAMHFISPT